MRNLWPVFCAIWMVAIICGSTANAIADLDGRPWRIDQSGIELTRVYSDWRSNYDTIHRRMGPIYFIDCAEFTNTGTHNVRNVQLMFALVGSEGKQESQPLPYDTHAAIAAGGRASACVAHGYENGYKNQLLIAWVNAVTHADGSRWHAVPAVEGTVENAPSSGVALGAPVTYVPIEECDNVTNASGKTITHLQIVFHHTGLDGASLGDDALDIHTKITPGEVLRNSCRSFNGYSEPGMFYYARALSKGDSRVPAPQIFFGGRDSKLSATVNSVDFADGTSWHDGGRR